MFLWSFSNYNDSELFLKNMLLVKKFKFAKSIHLCSDKLGQSKYPQKLMP